MTLRSSYTLGHSEFNDFLFACIGDEDNGMPLTVLSALTRLDVDPWQEASRLSDLSAEAAAGLLSTAIARLPAGQWTLADLPAIASRLIRQLPKHGAPATASSPARTARDLRPTFRRTIWLCSILLSALVIFFLWRIQANDPPAPVPTAVEMPHR